MNEKKLQITHSYEGLGRKYFKARKGTPQFAVFIVSHGGLENIPSDKPWTIVELGAGSGQQTEFVEKQLHAAGIRRYKILAYDKSFQPDAKDEPAQLNLLAERIKKGEISERVIPRPLDFDGAPLPLETASVDLCYMAWVLHHLKDQPGVMREIGRVLRKGAGFFMYQVTIEALRGHPLDEFFPMKYAYDRQRYPTYAQLKRMFLDAGLTYERPFIVKAGEDDPRLIDRTLLEDVANTSIDSVLMMIKDNDPQGFDKGVKKLEKEVECAECTGNYRKYERIDRKIFWGTKK
jgi:SAM-dependent methyltransferase